MTDAVDPLLYPAPNDGDSALRALSALVSERFVAVDTWVFDLDNTLYPASSAIWPEVDGRITRYLADLLGLDGLSARALQKFYYQHHGTTLRGLMSDHAVRPEAFLEFVHDIDRSGLQPNPALVEAIAALPGRKLILTNGSRTHALRTAERLGFAAAAFEDVFDIVAADLVPKPDAATYDRFFAAHGVEPKRAAMFEDIARNLEIPHRRGMATVLVAPRAEDDLHREDWERRGAADPHVDFVTDDLATFVAAIALGKRP